MEKATKKEERQAIRLMNLLDKIDELEHGDNFLWALQTGRIPTMIEATIWQFTGERTFWWAIKMLVRANKLRHEYKYPEVNQPAINKLVKLIDETWTVRT